MREFKQVLTKKSPLTDERFSALHFPIYREVMGRLRGERPYLPMKHAW
jgi:hypothetical protein